MADGITPVGAMVNPSAQGLQSLSNILGIQQQRQQLQLQAQELQRSQVQTQQTQGVNDFFSNFDYENHHGSDGTLDIDAAHQSPQFQALPGVAKIQVDAALNSIRAGQLKNKAELAQVNDQVLGRFTKTASAIALHPEQAPQLIDNFISLGPDEARIGTPYKQQLANVPPDKLSAMANAIADQGTDIINNRPKAGTIETPTNIYPTQVQPESGLQIPTGQNVPKPLGAQVATFPSGQVATMGGPTTGGAFDTNFFTGAAGGRSQPQAVVGGGGQTRTKPSTAPPPSSANGLDTSASLKQPGMNDPKPLWDDYTAKVAALNGRLQAAKADEYGRPQALDALQRARGILSQPGAPPLGTSFEFQTYIKNALSSLGIDTKGATDANELVKNLARAEAGRAENSSIGKTDTSRRLLSQGAPNFHIDNQAALNIIDQSIATELAGRGYIKSVGKYQGDPNKMSQAESAYTQIPHLIQSYELGLKRNPQEAESFYQQYGVNPEDMKSAVQKLKTLGAL